MSLCGFAHTFSHVWMHAHTHAPAVPEAKIAAEEERNHSREGKWKHVFKKKGFFNFHESSVRRVICFSLSIFLFLPRGLSPSTTPPVCRCHWLCLSLLLPSWQQHIRYEGLGLCVCRSKYPGFSSWITFVFSSSSSFVRLPVLSLTSLQRACPHLYHRPSCLLFCTLSRLLPVPSPSSTSLH